MSAAATLPAKPVKLELNNSGAWKTLARFNAADEAQCDLAFDAGERLARLNPKASLRVATADGLSEVLMCWKDGEGWVPA